MKEVIRFNVWYTELKIPTDLMSVIRSGDMLHYAPVSLDMSRAWALLGSAEIEFDLLSVDEIEKNTVKAKQERLAKLLKEASERNAEIKTLQESLGSSEAGVC